MKMKTSILFLSMFLSFNLFAQEPIDQLMEKGKTLYEQKEYAQAQQVFQQAVNVQPENYEAIKYLADSKHKQELFVAAIADYDRAEELRPNESAVYFDRGAAKVFIEEFRSAIKDLDKAIELDPNNAEIYYFRGFSHAELEKYNNAIEDYSKAIELDPDYAAAYYNRGAAKAEQKHYEAGMSDFEIALNKKPDLVNGRINIALSKLGMEKYEEAITDLTAVIDMRDENLARAYFYRGEAQYELKKKENACADWRRASNLGHEQATENVNDFCESRKSKPKRDIEIVF
jgi:tetratricopeptide (TPR) repeat protein